MSIVRRAALHAAISTVLALVALASIAAMPGARAWAANAPGGLSIREPEPEPSTEPTTEPTGPGGRATVVRGRAIAPADAPTAVRKVIAAANQIRSKPYIWGGGHGR
jgi:cell wall-associated NlpC family hydrolase